MLNLAGPGAADGRTMLNRVSTLTRVASAVAQTGADVLVLQRFSQDEDLVIDAVRYCLRCDATHGAIARPWTSIHKLLTRARGWQPDILHVNGLIFPTQVVMARMALTLGRNVPIVVQHHGELPSSRRTRLLQRLGLRYADAFIFNGAGNADVWRAAGIIRPHQPVFEAVEGSCDFEMLPQDEARRITGMLGAPAVLWVGRLHPRKDPLTAFEGFARALTRMPSAQLYMIYQDDTLLPTIQARLTQSPELASHVHLIGRVLHAELPRWYSAADIFLTSSPAEGSNYALIESMSCGATPVCSDIPPHWFLTNGCAMAECWAVGNVQACAKALQSSHEHRTDQTRQLVRTWFDGNLSWRAIGQQLKNVYQAMLDQPHQG
jgi:glycosyltransferase involved in cell wall biosynthesis